MNLSDMDEMDMEGMEGMEGMGEPSPRPGTTGAETGMPGMDGGS